MSEVTSQYGRMKGASWFPFIHKKDVMILGQGGIGSWVALLVGRMGANLYLYDGDHYEEHNMSGQLVRLSDLGKRKSDVSASIIKSFSPDSLIEAGGMYTDKSPSNDIVICGFDNMDARKLAFDKWVAYVNSLMIESDKSKCFFQDGRLNAEYYQIFNIPGDKPDLIKKYRDEYLFEDKEVTEQDCTFKQTSHMAAAIASKMACFFINWVDNVGNNKSIRQVPFFSDYLAPLNMTKNDKGI